MKYKQTLKIKLEEELARLKNRQQEGHAAEQLSLGGSIMTVQKILGWLR